MKDSNDGKITSAEAVNRIVDRFRMSPPVFREIDLIWVKVEIGCRRYVVKFLSEYHVDEVDSKVRGATSHAKWVEDILNGKVRNESGEMVEKVTTE